jgi:hypothetical protein
MEKARDHDVAPLPPLPSSQEGTSVAKGDAFQVRLAQVVLVDGTVLSRVGCGPGRGYRRTAVHDAIAGRMHQNETQHHTTLLGHHTVQQPCAYWTRERSPLG